MKHSSIAALGMLVMGCARSADPSAQPAMEPPAAAPPRTTPASSALPISATMRFCAYGGVGLALPADAENAFASMVVELDNPGAPIGGVAVLKGALLDGQSAPLASLRRVDHLVVFSPAKPSSTQGTFAVHLNPPGTPFSGTLPSGRTTLRVRVALDHAPGGSPARCHLELGGVGGAPLVVEGNVDGAWPT
jgi:hypothetical protein